MILTFTIADTGEILSVGAVSADNLEANLHFIPTDRLPDPKTEYWNGTALTPRPLHNITINKTTCNADGFDTITLQNVSGKLFIDSVEYPVPATTVDITFDEPGQHFIRVKNFPTQDFEATVNAN